MKGTILENPLDKLKIAIDGGADLPTGWMSEFKIRMIPINILFGERTYLQGVELSDQEFYRMAREGGSFPKTSQPSPHQFIQFYRSIRESWRSDPFFKHLQQAFWYAELSPGRGERAHG